MNDEVNLPELKEYVSIKQAAEMLGLAYKTVHQYVTEGRIPAVRVVDVILIPVAEVKKFKPNMSGRPRKSVPRWHISPADNTLLATIILVQMRSGQEAKLAERLDEIRRSSEHLFPGTISRYIMERKQYPGQVEIILIWRSSVMPASAKHEQALAAFRQSLDDVLDWSTAQYDEATILMHA
ncbi:MAG: helix-turn-helix domain-containing protein [Ktedonobacteraceae bacterium]